MDPVQGNVNVTLLLDGGHSRSLSLSKNDPLLRSLLASIEDKADGGSRVPRPYHLHLDDGRQSFIFSGRDLVGVVIDPPLVARDRPALPAGQHESRYRLVENFLDAKEHEALLRFAVTEEARFVDATVSTNDTDYRRSKVLYDIPRYSRLFREKVAALAPQLMRDFAIAPFTIADIECQMTAHNDGNYFRRHNDNGSPDTATRTISYVYYFFNEPKAFSGGDFRLFHSRVENGAYCCGDHAADIAPKNNSVLFFPSYCQHEVLKVLCPSERFADGRFTVNGWIRRAA
jgi:Rps23 Pro-64 3,4-dihydroxylase Tpa1-like proline 4-hydroxylase